jgi:microsomal dipeptidase-like Zn-dependent dipeptidase
LEEKWVRKIAERRGICGIIYCDHYMRDGRGEQTRTIEDSFAVIDGHIATLRAWGGDDILAIGSDLDGFIKPTLAGLHSAAGHKLTAQHLVQTYGEALASKICHGNALRMLEACWRRRMPLSASTSTTLRAEASSATAL